MLDSSTLERTSDSIHSARFFESGALEGIGVSLPATADRASFVGLGRSERHGLSLKLVGARAVSAELVSGKTVYAGVLPGVDAVWASGPSRAELFFVVRSVSSPELRFELAFTRGERIAKASVDETGRVHFADPEGRDVLTMPPAFAVDARGTRRAVTASLNGDVLSLRLDARDLAAPIVVDPALEVWTWTQKTAYGATSGAPNARKNAGMAFDANRNKIVLFGGAGGGARCDTWEYTGGAWTNPIVATSSAACPVAGSPPQRINTAMAYDADKKNVVLFGGYSAPTYTDDTWLYTGGTTWAAACGTCVSGTTKPGGRGAPAMAYDEARKVTVMFGGYNAVGGLCDTWEWNGSSWSMKSDGTGCGTTTKPAARSFTAMAYDAARSVTVLYGGQGDPPNYFLDDTWEWNGTAWSKVSTITNIPVARRDHVLAYDNYRARVVLFGGVTGNSGGPTAALNDTYELSAGNWVTTTVGTAPTTAPKWRWAASGAFDRSARKLVVYGGQEASTAGTATGSVDDDTWEYGSYGGGCSTAAQCDTGFCEDGVCCKTACAACQRCDVAGTVGTCTGITSAEDTSGTTCSGTSFCNASGSCVSKIAKGGACSTAGGGDLMCATGHCYLTGGGAGTCCDTACTGGCQGCTAAETGGAAGTCANVTAGSKRADTTATTTLCGSPSAMSTCGNDGSCDGAGGCRKWISSTVCVNASCASATSEKKTSYCSGSGACGTTSETPCATGYACVGTACKTSCTGDSDCASTHYCVGGTCTLKKVNGTACAAGNECSTGNCPTQDKVCCDAACSGPCEACTGAKKGSGADGTCGAIADGGDPDSECPDPPAYACSASAGMGVCNGAKACRAFAKTGTACAAGTTCTAGEQTGKACDGAGNCISGSVVKCTPYKCDGAGVACLAKCTADSDCADAKLFFCDKLGLCQPRKAAGDACGTSNECATGASCADGVCCDTTCTGQCESCVETGKKGTCVAVTGDPRNGRTACGGDKTGGCAGTCDGKNRAACFYDVGKECGATCAANKATVSKCDATGTCKAEPEVACNGYKCTSDGKRCASTCAGDTDCEDTYKCEGSSCVPRGAKCVNGDTAAEDATGKQTSCYPYKCRVEKCLEQCTITDDCIAPKVCDGNKCVEPTSPSADPTSSDDGGCGCSTPGRTTTASPLLLLVVGLLARRFRERARRSSRWA